MHWITYCDSYLCIITWASIDYSYRTFDITTDDDHSLATAWTQLLSAERARFSLGILCAFKVTLTLIQFSYVTITVHATINRLHSTEWHSHAGGMIMNWSTSSITEMIRLNYVKLQNVHLPQQSQSLGNLHQMPTGSGSAQALPTYIIIIMKIAKGRVTNVLSFENQRWH